MIGLFNGNKVQAMLQTIDFGFHCIRIPLKLIVFAALLKIARRPQHLQSTRV